LVGYVVPAAGVVVEGGELRQWLGSRLPEFMVPAAVVLVDDLPLTSNGKLDRRALPAPEWQSSGSDDAADQPSNEVERLLAQLFAEVLGLDQVGVNDGFFELGGDSIIAIQLVSRARQEGLRFTPRQVFQHRTVAALAQVATQVDDEAVESPEVAIGELPLPPVMQWYQEQGAPVERFVQSVLLQVPADLGAKRLEAAVQAVLDHHDALRMRVVTTDQDGWRAGIAPKGAVPASNVIHRIDVSELDETAWAEVLNTETDAAIDRLRPDSGLMMQVVWFDAGPHRSGRLLCVVHHLVVDGVSWRILVPDLVSAWHQLRDGAPADAVALPPGGTSYRRWAQQMEAEARRREREEEVDLWLDMLDGPDPSLGSRPLDPAVDTVGAATYLNISFPPALAGKLLTEVAAAYNSGPDEVLLTGLALAVAQWRRSRGITDDDTIMVNIEGHGRESLVEGLDLSRTLGWFTSMYPVRLPVGRLTWSEVTAGSPAVGDVLKQVKERMRGLPDKGAGYGLLRYLNPSTGPLLATVSHPQIGFNYLGRFSSTMGAEAVAGADWSAAPEHPGLGGTQNPQQPHAHVVEINASAVETPDGMCLQASVSFPSEVVSEAAVQELIDVWREALSGLVRLVEQGGRGRTPSDFPLVSLTQQQLAQLEETYPNLVDVLPLAPLQEGLLFHAVHQEEASGVYLVQFGLGLEGPLDSAALRRALGDLLERHANLKAGFHYEGLAEPVQVIPGPIEVPWREVDLSGLPESEQQTRLDALFKAYQGIRFDPTRPPMVRFVLARLGPERHQLLFNTHHILLDGWSVPIIFSDLMALYDAAAGGDSSLQPVRPFRDYLDWVRQQDRGDSHAAWRNALAGLPEPTKLAAEDQNADPPLPEHLTSIFSAELFHSMGELARQQDVTTNTVIETAWALILRNLTGRSDVVFGRTVSGRNPELQGIETMVGLFINTVPVRIQLDGSESIRDLLHRFQQEQAQLLPHQHIGLGEIQRLLGAGELFDSSLVYENFPHDPEQLSRPLAGGLRLVGASSHDIPHFPLTLAVAPGEQLIVRLTHRPDLLDRSNAERILAYLKHALLQMVEAPERTVDDITFDSVAAEEA
jgi:non-ribosomal peptide synthase protein (TIGR01720 family)